MTPALCARPLIIRYRQSFDLEYSGVGSGGGEGTIPQSLMSGLNDSQHELGFWFFLSTFVEGDYFSLCSIHLSKTDQHLVHFNSD